MSPSKHDYIQWEVSEENKGVKYTVLSRGDTICQWLHHWEIDSSCSRLLGSALGINTAKGRDRSWNEQKKSSCDAVSIEDSSNPFGDSEIWRPFRIVLRNKWMIRNLEILGKKPRCIPTFIGQDEKGGLAN